MASIKHYITGNSINIHNFYKYMCNLFISNGIPSFVVSFDNNLNNIIYTIVYNNQFGKNGTSKIIYNIYTKKWSSHINTITYDEIYSNYYYLIENNMVSFDNINQTIILESYNIDDILEPSLNPLNNNLRNIINVDNTIIHNVSQQQFYLFIKNLLNYEEYSKFKNTWNKIETKILLPIEISNNIYKFYSNSNHDFNFYKFNFEYL